MLSIIIKNLNKNYEEIIIQIFGGPFIQMSSSKEKNTNVIFLDFTVMLICLTLFDLQRANKEVIGFKN